MSVPNSSVPPLEAAVVRRGGQRRKSSSLLITRCLFNSNFYSIPRNLMSCPGTFLPFRFFPLGINSVSESFAKMNIPQFNYVAHYNYATLNAKTIGIKHYQKIKSIYIILMCYWQNARGGRGDL